jgi:hypothetical protein
VQFPGTLSAVGGALGLYVGFCGVTLFEILELVTMIVFALVGSRLMWKRRSKPSMADNPHQVEADNNLSNQRTGRRVAPAVDAAEYLTKILSVQDTMQRKHPEFKN